jgi:integrase
VFKPAAEAIGVPGLTPHDLRHTAAMTLDVYAGLFGDDLDAGAERLDEAAATARADYLRTQAGLAGVVPLDLAEAHGL